MIASAGVIGVGLLTYDGNTPYALAAFDITNFTGGGAFPPDFPITTPLAITVTNLVANLQGGGTIIIPGTDFTVVDSSGDLNCTVTGDASTGGCDFAAHSLVSATLTGKLSPLTGLGGLPPGTSILSTFTTTILPGCGPTLTVDCDTAVINASTVPEPATWLLVAPILIGLLAGYKWRRTAINFVN
jgi:hypothetical protein